MKPLLYLIGYRGTGKTTAGQLLAARIGWEFVDADVFLETRYAKSIKEIFAEEGEAGFREKESICLRELTGRRDCIVATGGGIVLRQENRTLIHETGTVVWLTAAASTISRRIQGDSTSATRRPNLSIGGLAEIEELLRFREPLYRACADLEIASEGLSPERLVETILTRWNPITPSSSK